MTQMPPKYQMTKKNLLNDGKNLETSKITKKYPQNYQNDKKNTHGIIKVTQILLK
jgi:hypothetical protein